MKDLLVILAGKNDEAVIRSVLSRHQDIGIHHLIFEINRLGSDSKVVGYGPTLALAEKNRYRYFLCIWDHQGSGREKRMKPNQVQGIVQKSLNGKTLKGRSKALVIDPELEIWLWQDKEAICKSNL
jgi:hypothetical protein